MIDHLLYLFTILSVGRRRSLVIFIDVSMHLVLFTEFYENHCKLLICMCYFAYHRNGI